MKVARRKQVTRHKIFVFAVVYVALLCCSAEARAQVLVRLQVDVSTAPGGATINGQTGLLSTGVFNVNFGNVNGLGIGPRPAGVSISRVAGGTLYSTPILITPTWTCVLTCPTGTITLWLDAAQGTSAGRAAVREGASPGSASPVNASPPKTITTTATNGVPITRHVGLFVSNANGAGRVSGPVTARVVYQISIP
jgi:hypothetical protein